MVRRVTYKKTKVFTGKKKINLKQQIQVFVHNPNNKNLLKYTYEIFPDVKLNIKLFIVIYIKFSCFRET